MNSRMQSFILVSICFLGLTFGYAQQFDSCVKELKKTDKKGENKVLLCAEDLYQSTYYLSLKTPIALHYHALHSENIFVLSGRAKMQLGEDVFFIKKGMHVHIPKGTPHAVLDIIGRKRFVVISVQSPKFDGVDRKFISTKNK